MKGVIRAFAIVYMALYSILSLVFFILLMVAIFAVDSGLNTTPLIAVFACILCYSIFCVIVNLMVCRIHERSELYTYWNAIMLICTLNVPSGVCILSNVEN